MKKQKKKINLLKNLKVIVFNIVEEKQIGRKLNNEKFELEKKINEEHNDIIKETIKLRALEQKINEVQFQKNKLKNKKEIFVANEKNIEVYIL